MQSTNESRSEMVERLFPGGIPRLWCPTLTHFSEPACPDRQRIEKHLRSLAPYVKGILVPGSTGEGWEMSDQDILGLLPSVLDIAEQLNIKVLIGVLKTDASAMVGSIGQLARFANHAATVGFTVCPPKGSELTQQEISVALRRVLDLGYPTALYQLPQVTQNEMSSELVQSLAAEFPNFYLFKDTSGFDRVALTGLETNVFMVRGSEKNGYSQWLRETGGPYDGFLLSSANVLAKQLSSIIQLLASGNRDEADRVSEKIANLVSRAFAMVQDFQVGNAFTNTNKALDHHRAFGERATEFPPPLLYSGTRLPSAFIEQAAQLLREHGLQHEAGYCLDN